MFIVDGIAYAGEPVEELTVSSARYVADGIILVTFSTGETRLFDATCLQAIPAFAPLNSEAVLRDFKVEYGVLTWCHGEIDIAPETLYERSFEYQQVA